MIVRFLCPLAKLYLKTLRIADVNTFFTNILGVKYYTATIWRQSLFGEKQRRNKSLFTLTFVDQLGLNWHFIMWEIGSFQAIGNLSTQLKTKKSAFPYDVSRGRLYSRRVLMWHKVD